VAVVKRRPGVLGTHTDTTLAEEPSIAPTPGCGLRRVEEDMGFVMIEDEFVLKEKREADK